MEKYLNMILLEYRYPIVNSLMLSNGELFILEYPSFNQQKVRILCQSTIESYFKYNDEDDTTSFDILTKYENEDYQAFVGEGSMGSDGIIYLIRKSDKKLLWFLFLDNSNPFIKVSIQDDKIVAFNSKEQKWILPISNPQNISIERKSLK